MPNLEQHVTTNVASVPLNPLKEQGVRVTAANDPFSRASVVKPKRTLGHKVVDGIIYSINNFGVFALSVGATYLTQRGDTVGEAGSTARKIGSALKKRGDWVHGKLVGGLGMSAGAADTAKMVFFSFADGTILAPFVKLLEDQRTGMAKWFDKKLGTEPNEKDAYTTEPVQTWASVVEGRALTSLVVVPTAVALEKTTVKTASGAFKNLNQLMFDGPSATMGKWLESHTSLLKRFPKIDLPFLSKTMIFEGFYTTVCTGGLYFISRAIASRSKDHKEAVANYIEHHHTRGEPAHNASELSVNPERPLKTITEPSLDARITNSSLKERNA